MKYDLWQWLLGYESTLFLFQKDKVSILCSALKGMEVSTHHTSTSHAIVSSQNPFTNRGRYWDRPIEILAQAKGKEAPNDALPRFVQLYTSNKCVGTLLKVPTTYRK